MRAPLAALLLLLLLLLVPSAQAADDTKIVDGLSAEGATSYGNVVAYSRSITENRRQLVVRTGNGSFADATMVPTRAAHAAAVTWRSTLAYTVQGALCPDIGLWVRRGAGRARRVDTSFPRDERISTDGRRVAWAARRGEVHNLIRISPLDGGRSFTLSINGVEQFGAEALTGSPEIRDGVVTWIDGKDGDGTAARIWRAAARPRANCKFTRLTGNTDGTVWTSVTVSGRDVYATREALDDEDSASGLFRLAPLKFRARQEIRTPGLGRGC